MEFSTKVIEKMAEIMGGGEMENQLPSPQDIREVETAGSVRWISACSWRQAK